MFEILVHMCLSLSSSEPQIWWKRDKCAKHVPQIKRCKSEMLKPVENVNFLTRVCESTFQSQDSQL